MKLNIGSGDIPLPGFVQVDRKNGDDAYPLRISCEHVGVVDLLVACKVQRDEQMNGYWELPDNFVDEIRASHVLEHFGHQDSELALREWVRVLKPGGRIRIAVPDFAKIAQAYIDGQQLPIAGYVMGGQTDADDFHRTLFDEEHLTRMMIGCGLTDIKPWKSEVDDCAALPISLNLEGTKADSAQQLSKPFPRHRKIVAVMSMPRLCFSETMFSALQVATAFSVPFVKHTGAWWDQCLSRVMEQYLNDGTEFICVIDYDSMFNAADFHQLAVLMDENPEADAIAPMQVKRAEDTGLFRPIDPITGEYRTGVMKLEEMDAPLIPVGWANFGLTFLRVSALKKMKRPWFIGVPDKNGGWGDGRTDPDIYFWQNFRESGCKLYVASHVSVGHLQLMSTWPTQELDLTHQYVTEYLKNGKPQEARR